MKLIINIILFLISIISVIIVFPISMIYTLIRNIYSQRLEYWYERTSEYFFDIAYSIDQLGNVILASLLTDALLKHPYHFYIFGDPDETISSVIGRNKRIKNLSWVGEGIRIFLDLIDKDHCELAAQYYLLSINKDRSLNFPYGKNN